jgi:hypothetical protein
MSKHDDERERERSARKKAEVDAVVNNNRETVYNYVASRKDVVGKTCVEELGFFAKGKRYLEWLYLHGHLTRMKRTINGGRHCVYNAATPYVKPVSTVSISMEEMDAKKKIASVTRVYNLLDRPQIPMTKKERERHTRSTKNVAIGSSMRMFGSW